MKRKYILSVQHLTWMHSQYNFNFNRMNKIKRRKKRAHVSSFNINVCMQCGSCMFCSCTCNGCQSDFFFKVNVFFRSSNVFWIFFFLLFHLISKRISHFDRYLFTAIVLPIKIQFYFFFSVFLFLFCSFKFFWFSQFSFNTFFFSFYLSDFLIIHFLKSIIRCIFNSLTQNKKKLQQKIKIKWNAQVQSLYISMSLS